MPDIPTPDEARAWPEVVADWVRRRLEEAPPRDEIWAEGIMATYLGEPLAQQRRAA